MRQLIQSFGRESEDYQLVLELVARSGQLFSVMSRAIFLWLMLVGILLGDERTTQGVVFANIGSTALKLDIYHAPRGEKASPVIVWVHGGAWRAGNREGVSIRGLVEMGYSVASVDYRLTPVAPFPANVHDIKAAIRFLRANADRYGIDPDRISIAGVSAGGHLAALVGLTNGSKAHEGSIGEHLKVSSGVGAVVSFYGASNLLSILDQSTEHGLSVRVPALKLLLGGTPVEKPDVARLASPIYQLDEDDPPVLLIHGDQDPQMPFEQSKELQRACGKMGVSCELIPVQGGVHGGKAFYEKQMLDRVAAFLAVVK